MQKRVSTSESAIEEGVVGGGGGGVPISFSSTGALIDMCDMFNMIKL